MQKRFKLLVLGILLLVIPLVLGANTITLQTPAASGSVSGTSYKLNASLDTNVANATNVTYYYSVDNSGTWVTIKSVDNDTMLDTSFNTTWDSTGIVDDESLAFSANATNASDIEVSTDTSTGVSVDNGNPTSTLSSTVFHDQSSFRSGDSFTVATDADSTIGVDNCTVYFTNLHDKTVVTKSITASSNACSTSYTDSTAGLTEGETYTMLVTVHDGNNDKTNSTTRLIEINRPSGEEVLQDTPQEKAVSGLARLGEIISNFFERLFSIFKR